MPDRPRHTIRLPHWFTVAGRNQIKRDGMQALDAGAAHLDVDCWANSYIDSSAFGVLVQLAKRCREGGGELTLQGLDPDLLEFVRLSRLDGYFTAQGRAADALPRAA